MWQLPPENLILSNSIHVWRIFLDVNPKIVQELVQSLSKDEIKKAERFHFQLHRKRYIVGRGALRQILSRYLGKNPIDLQFYYNEHGKPALLETDVKLCFNLSHAQEVALIAVTQNREIGVDIEYICTGDFAWEEIAARFFSPTEKEALSKVPASEKTRAFFNCWTRKEAYIKATGKGLALPLDEFDVTLAPGEPAALLYTNWDLQEASRWSLQELIPAPSYVGAIAVEKTDNWQLECYQWQRY